MTPTSPLAGLLTGLVDGLIIAAVVFLVLLLIARRQRATAVRHPVAEDRLVADRPYRPGPSPHDR